jgi:dolichol-phosphate mannosyltransferase
MSFVDISIVVPCYNEAENLNEFVARVRGVFSKLTWSYEIIFVDDGSTDHTLTVAIALTKKYSNIRVIELSRNFGHQYAVTAGIDHAEGDAIVLIDADLQDPPEVIEEMISKWQEGYDVIYAQRKTREGESFFKLMTASVFYRFLRFLNKNIPLDTGDFRLMDRKVVNAVKLLKEQHRFLRGIVSWVGFKSCAICYDRKPRFAGMTAYSIKKMVLFALDGITSFSILPLRLVTLIGMVTVLVSLCMVISIVFTKFLNYDYYVPGFPTIVTVALFFGGVQLVSLGIIGEYVGRIYEESKNRPLYIIKGIHSGNYGSVRSGDTTT